MTSLAEALREASHRSVQVRLLAEPDGSVRVQAARRKGRFRFEDAYSYALADSFDEHELARAVRVALAELQGGPTGKDSECRGQNRQDELKDDLRRRQRHLMSALADAEYDPDRQLRGWTTLPRRPR